MFPLNRSLPPDRRRQPRRVCVSEFVSISMCVNCTPQMCVCVFVNVSDLCVCVLVTCRGRNLVALEEADKEVFHTTVCWSFSREQREGGGCLCMHGHDKIAKYSLLYFSWLWFEKCAQVHRLSVVYLLSNDTLQTICCCFFCFFSTYVVQYSPKCLSNVVNRFDFEYFELKPFLLLLEDSLPITCQKSVIHI